MAKAIVAMPGPASVIDPFLPNCYPTTLQKFKSIKNFIGRNAVSFFGSEMTFISDSMFLLSP